ncbi:MAG: hypothetical protein QXV17_14765 [Candidatus Micrarchaeaceae archaeon]
MNMYEKIFHHNGNVVVKMDELTTRRKHLFLQFINREIKRQKKLCLSIFGKNDEKLLATTLDDEEYFPRFFFDDKRAVIGVEDAGRESINKYAIPYLEIHHFVVDTQLADGVISQPKYITAPLDMTAWRDIYEIIPWLTYVDEKRKVLEPVLGAMEDACVGTQYGRIPVKSDDEAITIIADAGVNAWQDVVKKNGKEINMYKDIVPTVQRTLHAIADRMWYYRDTNMRFDLVFVLLNGPIPWVSSPFY